MLIWKGTLIGRRKDAKASKQQNRTTWYFFQVHPWITKGQSLCVGDSPIAVPEGWDLDIVSEGGQSQCSPSP